MKRSSSTLALLTYWFRWFFVVGSPCDAVGLNRSSAFDPLDASITISSTQLWQAKMFLDVVKMSFVEQNHPLLKTAAVERYQNQEEELEMEWMVHGSTVDFRSCPLPWATMKMKCWLACWIGLHGTMRDFSQPGTSPKFLLLQIDPYGK